MSHFTIRIKSSLLGQTFIIHRCARTEQAATESARRAFPTAYRIEIA